MRGELDPDDSHGDWIIRACYYDSGDGQIDCDDATWGGAGSLDPTGQQEGGPVTTPSNAVTLRVQLYSEMTNGWVAYDDVSLHRVSTTNTTQPAPLTPRSWGETALLSPELGGGGAFRRD